MSLRLPRHRATTAQLAGLYPFVASAALPVSPVVLGFDRLGDSGVFRFDPFSLYRGGAVTNPNVVVFGEPGAGKSTAVKTLCRRLAASGPTYVAIIDPKGEYAPLADGLGLTVVRLRPGGQVRLNPLARTGADGDRARRVALLHGLLAIVMRRDPSGVEEAALTWVADELDQRDGPEPTLADVAGLLADPSPRMAERARRSTAELAAELDPFGQAVNPQTGVVITAANPCFTGSTNSSAFYRGEQRDKSTGRYQLGSRTYDPKTSSFLTPDSYRAGGSTQNLSVGVDPLTRNSYSYVNGDPINMVDPDGHFARTYSCASGVEGGQEYCPGPGRSQGRLTGTARRPSSSKRESQLDEILNLQKDIRAIAKGVKVPFKPPAVYYQWNVGTRLLWTEDTLAAYRNLLAAKINEAALTAGAFSMLTAPLFMAGPNAAAEGLGGARIPGALAEETVAGATARSISSATQQVKALLTLEGENLADDVARIPRDAPGRFTKGAGGNSARTTGGLSAHLNYENTLGGGDWVFNRALPGSRLRPDAVSYSQRIVRELKPNAPKAIASGWRQVNQYKVYLEELTGQPWTAYVDTYAP